MQLLPFIFRGSPAIPEMDFSGTVVETGSSVPSHRALQPGTPVFGSAPLSQHVKSTCGALAEYIVVDHSAIVLVPQNADLHEVAGLGIAGATALEVLRASRLKSGDAVLVNGASGGIGHLVLQMCMERVGPSGKVVAICSGKHVDWIHALTPNVQIINRDQEPLIPALVDGFADSRFDAVLDCVGIQAVFHACPAFLKQGKPYVTVGPRADRYTFFGMLGTLGTMARNMLWPKILGGTPREYVQVAAASNPAALEELADMVAEKKLKVYMGLRAVWDDVLLVSLSVSFETCVLMLNRHMRECSVDMLEGKLWWKFGLHPSEVLRRSLSMSLLYNTRAISTSESYLIGAPLQKMLRRATTSIGGTFLTFCLAPYLPIKLHLYFYSCTKSKRLISARRIKY